jgi:hypothetical protein
LRPFLILTRFVLSSLLVLCVACGASNADEESKGRPTPEPTPADHSAIRLVDFASLDETQALLQRLGSGRVAEREILFQDLTGDMREEAVVPITSDGTLGNVAYLVYTMKSDDPELILTRTMDGTTASGLVMSIDDLGSLRETVGIYGNEDPLCCPSELRLTTFRWDGSALQVAGEVKEENPNRAKD